MKTRIFPVIGAIALYSAAAQAQIINGSFSLGLTGWTLAGDVSNQLGTAFLTTASLLDDDFPAANGAFNFSGTAAVSSAPALESFSSLASGALDPDPGNLIFAYEGSAMKQSFSVGSGDTLSFQWKLLTNDPLADYAYVVINGTRTVLSAASAATTPSSPFQVETPFSVFTHTFTSAGQVELSVGVLDVNDFSGTTALQIDNVSLAAVPEPGFSTLCLMGIGSVLGLRRQRRTA